MKKIALIVLIGMMGMNVSAQDKIPSEKKSRKKERTARTGPCPGIYITTSTGINNNTAIMGFNFELPVTEHMSIDAGPGTGTWGSKVYVGGKYYLKTCQRGFAFGTGITYAPGVHHSTYDIKTIYGNTESDKFNKNPQTNMLFAAYKYWNLGRKYNRIYMELGWSVALNNGDKFTQLTGSPISDRSERELNSTAPGGPILAFGFSFGLR